VINILAISYKNIWPFEDKLLSIFFNNGKILIKAPIWSGKSFLFFDGPIYGLYKYSSRGILNTKSKEGYIKIIVEVDNSMYLIIRHIKKSKVKESCESKLYTIEGELPQFQNHEPIENDIDIEEILYNHKQTICNEINFKNETDLQQNLQTFLPPREVIMNTIFLMQDSDNIFELAPVERLTILKNVFNLLGIDEAKEILADKKREIRYKIKATTDISKYDEKLKNHIKNYLHIFESTKEIVYKKINTDNYQEFFDERKMIQEKIKIADFSLKEFPTDREDGLHNYIQNQKSQEQKIQHQLETTKKDIIQENNKTKELELHKEELKKNIWDIQKNIENVDEKTIEIYKQQKQKIVLQQNENELQIPKQNIWNFIQQQAIETETKDIWEITILTSYFLIQKIINEGKKKSEELKNIQLQIKNQELTSKNEKEKKDTLKKHLEEKILDQEHQKKNILKTLEEIEKNIDTQAHFNCQKIQSPCPFIKTINKKTFDQLELQKKGFLEQKTQIDTTIKNLQTQRDELHIEKKPQDEIEKKQLQIQQQEIENKIEAIKIFLHNIEYKKIEKAYEEYTNQEKTTKELDKKIYELEQQTKQIEERKTQLQKTIMQKESIEKHIKETINIIKQKETEQIKLQLEQKEIDTNNTTQLEKNHNIMKQHHHDIKMLIDEFKEHQIERQKLEEQETIFWNLYTIFSKELLLLVLQDHLPILNDIINNYLSQIVDYTINLQLNKSNSEKLELEAKILDSKWERDTKSLSGWQKIVLKLIRMLAISSYINSPILFLDETINNLDGEAVGKIADILENFVKQREMKFYTITHSQQIQEMDIRDKILEIK